MAGLAWPILRQRHSLGGAAIALAVPWAIWHVPTFWLETSLRGFSPLLVPGWLVGLTAGALVLGWMCEHARSSVLIVALLHATLNMVSATEATEGFVAAAASTATIASAIVLLRGARHRPAVTRPGFPPRRQPR